MEQQGILIILSSPSGAGKTSLARALVNENKNLSFSVSATTRKPRPGEKDGREKKIYLTKKGMEFSNNLFSSQKTRILSAFKKSSPDEVLYFKNVLKRIIE